MLKKLSALPILAFILLIEPLQAIAQQTPAPTGPQPPQGYYWPGPGHMWGNGYGWHNWGMFPAMLLFVLLICAIIFFVARRSCPYGSHHWGPPSHMMNRTWGDPSHSALQILNERFARGEIQKDEYEQKKAAILSGGPR